jgi:hypothetical protein
MGSVGEYEELKRLRIAAERIAKILEEISEKLTSDKTDKK